MPCPDMREEVKKLSIDELHELKASWRYSTTEIDVEIERRRDHRDAAAIQKADSALSVAKWSIVLAILALIATVVQMFWRI